MDTHFVCLGFALPQIHYTLRFDDAYADAYGGSEGWQTDRNYPEFETIVIYIAFMNTSTVALELGNLRLRKTAIPSSLVLIASHWPWLFSLATARLQRVFQHSVCCVSKQS